MQSIRKFGFPELLGPVYTTWASVDHVPRPGASSCSCLRFFSLSLRCLCLYSLFSLQMELEMDLLLSSLVSMTIPFDSLLTWAPVGICNISGAGILGFPLVVLYNEDLPG